MNTKFDIEYFPHKWRALIGLCLLSFTAFLDFTIVTTALPFIQKDLKASVLQLQWVVNIFSIILSMFMIAAGRAGDLFGRTRVFYLGFVLFAIAAIGAGASSTIQTLIFFRAIQGFAGAIIFTVGATLLPQAFPQDEQERAISIYGAFNGTGLAIGPFLGGFLITLFSWRWIFWINIPIIAAGFYACYANLKPAPQPDPSVKIDYLGLLFIIVGLGCFIYGMIHGEQVGWSKLLTWGYIVLGLVSLVLLVFVEKNVSHPFLDLSIFTHKQVSLALLVCIAAGVVTYVLLFFDSLFLEIIRKQSAFLIGLSLLTVPIVQVIISIFFPFLREKLGLINLLFLSLITTFIACVIHFYFMPFSPFYVILLAFVMMGFTWGMANVGTLAVLSRSLSENKVGGAIGTIFTFWNVSGSIMLALATIIFNWREKWALFHELDKSKIKLMPQELNEVHKFLINPEYVQTIAQSLGRLNSNDIVQALYASFLNGFHTVAIFFAGVMVVILGIAFKLR